jgi:diaminohydroxyphosphoribosylaminopyrimidine deaminase/5-amino-6-(5-phosphoribosylamino)uracil reductase
MTPSREEFMHLAIAEGERARLHAPPNPWVGALLVDLNGNIVGQGHTQVPGDAHAEIVALSHAGEAARGATLYVTLEPCVHHGRTGPCTEAIIAAGVSRVVLGVRDPDERVAGAGIAALRDAGIDVSEDVAGDDVRHQLAPYLFQRRTGRPYVVAKVAATLDGRVAMADGTSQWITDQAAREDAHLVRAQSQAIVVGAGTVRSDNPRLTARLGDVILEPLRVVAGRAPSDAAIHPCLEIDGAPSAIVDELGRRGVIQVLIEGGPRTIGRFVEAGLVQRFIWYVAPAFAGDEGTLGALTGLSTPTIAALRRGRLADVRRIGETVRLDVEV